MGLWNSFFKKNEVEWPLNLYASGQGQYIKMEDIEDAVFSEGILGKCCGIEPDQGVVYAPCDCVVISVSDTLHAFSLQANDMVDILIHVGIDTVNMNGEGFDLLVKKGQRISALTPILRYDIEKVKKAGYKATIIMAITNSNEFHITDILSEKESITNQDTVFTVNR